MPSVIKEFVALMSNQLNPDVLDNIKEHFFAQLIQTKWRNSHYYLTKKCQETLSWWFFWEFGSPFAQQPIYLIFDKTSGIIRNHNRSLSLDEDFEILKSSLTFGNEFNQPVDNLPTGLQSLIFERFFNDPNSLSGVYSFTYGSTSNDRILWSSKDTSIDLARKMAENKPLYGHFLIVIENSICHFLHLPEKPFDRIHIGTCNGVEYFVCFFNTYREIWIINSKGQVVSKSSFPDGVEYPSDVFELIWNEETNLPQYTMAYIV